MSGATDSGNFLEVGANKKPRKARNHRQERSTSNPTDDNFSLIVKIMYLKNITYDFKTRFTENQIITFMLSRKKSETQRIQFKIQVALCLIELIE